MNLTDEEKLALVSLLERRIRDDPYPLSPRVRTLNAIVEKLLDLAPGGEPLPPRPKENARRRKRDTGGAGIRRDGQAA